jgi:hypothetical protein
MGVRGAGAEWTDRGGVQGGFRPFLAEFEEKSRTWSLSQGTIQHAWKRKL